MRKSKCFCTSIETLIFSCAGGSNVGQIANQAAIELTKMGHGKIYCLAGIGGHVSHLIESTKIAKKIVAIEGCPVQCSKKVLEHTGFGVDIYGVVTEMEVKKNYDLSVDPDDVKKVVDKVSSEILKAR
ncbi:MAG TPA: zinc-binding protein [Methanocellales archaeon]|nr:zinc-binding protein [Methanocellales archaeon]